MNSDSKLVIPEYFTGREGGDWIPYTEAGFTLAVLERAVIGRFMQKVEDSKDKLLLIASDKNGRRYYIHSMLFADPSECDPPRWDEYNGWTTKL
jgi:hypothetical protein